MYIFLFRYDYELSLFSITNRMEKGHKIKAYLVMRKILLNSVRVTATLIYDCNKIRNDNEFYGEE